MKVRGVNVIGSVKREYQFNSSKERVQNSLLGLLEESDEVEGAFKWSKTLEINSIAEIQANLFEKKKKYWAKGEIVDGSEGTSINLKIGIYWVWEFSIIIGIIMVIGFLGVILYDHFHLIFTRKGEYAEFGPVIVLVAYSFWLYRIWKIKSLATRTIDRIMKNVEEELDTI
ncbi:MAG: hypothetical protein R3B93_07495 [Bacteroidia bacterium]